MAYKAQKTGQITMEGEMASTLETHELDDNGEILCGQPVRPWRGNRMVLTPKGPGIASCGRCARIMSR